MNDETLVLGHFWCACKAKKGEKYCLTLFLCKSTLFQSWQLLCASRNSFLPQRSSRSDSSEMLRAQLFVNLYYYFPHNTQTLSILFLFKNVVNSSLSWIQVLRVVFPNHAGGPLFMTFVIPQGLSSVAFIASVDLHTQLQQGKQKRWPQIRRHVLTRHAQTHTWLSAHITHCASPSFHMHYTGFSIPATGIIITQLSPSLAPVTSSLALFFSPRDSLLLSHSHFLSLFLSICNWICSFYHSCFLLP